MDGHDIIPLSPADMDELAESYTECLDQAITDNKNLGFSQLTEKSHDAAWLEVGRNAIMSDESIARVAGANQDVIDHLKNHAENEAFLSAL